MEDTNMISSSFNMDLTQNQDISVPFGLDNLRHREQMK